VPTTATHRGSGGRTFVKRPHARCLTDPDHKIKENAMTPWIISHDLMRANEEERIRATRYAHHRADTYRRLGRFLASLIPAWMSTVAIPGHVNTAPKDLTPTGRDPLYLTVVNLGSDDIGGAPDVPVPRRRIA
jgi:hypothetical protein